MNLKITHIKAPGGYRIFAEGNFRKKSVNKITVGVVANPFSNCQVISIQECMHILENLTPNAAKKLFIYIAYLCKKRRVCVDIESYLVETLAEVCDKMNTALEYFEYNNLTASDMALCMFNVPLDLLDLDEYENENDEEWVDAVSDDYC